MTVQINPAGRFGVFVEANCPVTDAAFKIVDWLPATGTKPFAGVTVTVPFRFAAPVIFNCENCVPGVVPPMRPIFSESEAPCV